MPNRNLNNKALDSDALSHEVANELLHLYAHEIIYGGSPELRYPDVATHLATCAICQADLDNVLQLVRPVYAGDDEVMPAYPPLKLERLKPPWRTSETDIPSWFVDRLGRLWLEFSEALLAVFQSREWAGAPREPHLLYEHQVNRKTSQEIAWSIKISSEQGSDETAAVQLHIDVPGLGVFNQAGSQVILQADSLILHAETDELGDVIFKGISRLALSTLRLKVIPAQMPAD